MASSSEPQVVFGPKSISPGVAPRLFVAVSLGIATLTLIAYAPIRHNDFIHLDDRPCIVAVPEMHEGLTLSTFGWAWLVGRDGFWHPLVTLSLLADVSIFGFGPWGMHFTNLLLHIATSIGLFVVFARMTGAFWRSACLAALYALHPMHVESVCWAVERKGLLSSLFLVLTIASYVDALRRPNRWRQLRTTVLFALGLLAKPMIVTLPFGLLLLDVWPLGRTNLTKPTRMPIPPLAQRSWTELVVEKIPLFRLSLVFSVLAYVTQAWNGSVFPIAQFSWLPRIANILNGYLWYVESTFVPIHLGPYYSVRFHVSVADILLPAAVLVGITVVLVRLFRPHPELLIGWLWFGGTLFIVSGISQVGQQSRADRFSNVPHIGLFLTIVWGSAIVVQRFRIWPAFAATLTVLVLGVLAVLTYRQVELWRDTGTLFRHTVEVTTDNYLAMQTLAEYCWTKGRIDEAAQVIQKALPLDGVGHEAFDLYALICIRQRKFAEAEHAVRRSLALDDDAERKQSLAYVLFMQNRYDESIQVLGRLLQSDPRRANSLTLVGKIFAAQHRYDEAAKRFEAALKLRPDYAEAHTHLALVQFELGRSESAEANFSEAIRLEPNDEEARSGLIRARILLRRWSDAVQAATDAMERFPKTLAFRGQRALALHRLGRRDEARKDYDELERLAPGWAENAAATALRLSSSESLLGRQEALESAEQAAQATEFGDARALEALAAAQAALSQSGAAIETIDRALALPKLPADLRDRLRGQREKLQRPAPAR
jgi:protein O-mannosyl-transferase